jgi:hypothetical protein
MSDRTIREVTTELPADRRSRIRVSAPQVLSYTIYLDRAVQQPAWSGRRGSRRSVGTCRAPRPSGTGSALSNRCGQRRLRAGLFSHSPAMAMITSGSLPPTQEQARLRMLRTSSGARLNGSHGREAVIGSSPLLGGNRREHGGSHSPGKVRSFGGGWGRLVALIARNSEPHSQSGNQLLRRGHEAREIHHKGAGVEVWLSENSSSGARVSRRAPRLRSRRKLRGKRPPTGPP